MKHIELLAPAGSYEALRAAIKAGCNAIYFGVSGFNMRANTAAAFSIEDLREIARICHEANIKCYLALNTLVYDGVVEEMKLVIDAVKESRVDAVIVFDPSVIQYAQEQGVEVHISTQHSISNIEAVKFFSKWADRLVLARELTLEQIKYITEQIKEQNICGPKGKQIEIEVFIHGAMCVAVSGRCGMSLYMYNTSANCGTCSQPCRRKFTVTDKATKKQLDVDNEYVMSTEDLCTIGMLDEIIDSGVVSLKIEGRGRAPEYVDEVVRCYREAITTIEDGTYSNEKIVEWNRRLGTVFNRGMSEGFYRGLAFKYWSGEESSKATQTREFVGVVKNFFQDVSVAECEIQAMELNDGDACIILSKDEGVIRFTAEHMRKDETSITQAAQKDIITFKVPEPVKRGERLYKIIPTKTKHTS
ncbi:MAG: U32 family peptidase [Candidatus Uhrbacteria bacterium]|nr:U32 family peptidase [Candidatus Uhrbacteria bacterium]